MPSAAAFAIGLAAGAFGGLMGVGGGLITIPLLVRFFGLRQQAAHGTSLVALVFTGAGGALAYAVRGTVDPLAAALMASTAVWTAPVGARHAHALPERSLRRWFALFVLVVVAALLLRPLLAGEPHPVSLAVKVPVLLATGLFTGYLVGMMGVGGGVVMVPAMVLLVGFTQVQAQGSSLLAMVPAGAAGAATHWRLGNVARPVLPGLVLGILCGALAGGSLAQVLPQVWLRHAFAAMLLWTGIRGWRKGPPDAPEEGT
ncbi:MAG: sulfite exporter TauE/SafE family protein [Deltaproteobacteria bacterium]|nr:sulfite exporter TauE/SafE family protein [Deltaproteobacteria bacterium]